jgi:hypothetical protein
MRREGVTEMNATARLWIDHGKDVIVIVSADGPPGPEGYTFEPVATGHEPALVQASKALRQDRFREHHIESRQASQVLWPLGDAAGPSNIATGTMDEFCPDRPTYPAHGFYRSRDER